MSELDIWLALFTTCINAGGFGLDANGMDQAGTAADAALMELKRRYLIPRAGAIIPPKPPLS
jgi:hypothetical protein